MAANFVRVEDLGAMTLPAVRSELCEQSHRSDCKQAPELGAISCAIQVGIRLFLNDTGVAAPSKHDGAESSVVFFLFFVLLFVSSVVFFLSHGSVDSKNLSFDRRAKSQVAGGNKPTKICFDSELEQVLF